MTDSPLLLLVLLAAIVAVPLLLKRHRAAAPDGIRVLGRTALHKNAVVAVIVVGDRRLLVGAGERGVDLLAELDQHGTDDVGHLDGGTATTSMTTSMAAPATPATTSTNPFGRTDTAEPTPHASSDDALAALVPTVSGKTNDGPGIGLIDRLRALTVRAPMRGRPSHDPLRR